MCIFISLDSTHNQKKSFCVISISLFVYNNHVPKITQMVHCIDWSIKSSFSHLTLITSIHLNIIILVFYSFGIFEFSHDYRYTNGKVYLLVKNMVIKNNQKIQTLPFFFNIFYAFGRFIHYHNHQHVDGHALLPVHMYSQKHPEAIHAFEGD